MLPYWVTVVFHLPGGKEDTYTIHKDEYKKIVDDVETEGSLIGKKRHFYVRDPNNEQVRKAMSIASTGYDDFLLEQFLPY